MASECERYTLRTTVYLYILLYFLVLLYFFKSVLHCVSDLLKIKMKYLYYFYIKNLNVNSVLLKHRRRFLDLILHLLLLSSIFQIPLLLSTPPLLPPVEEKLASVQTETGLKEEQDGLVSLSTPVSRCEVLRLKPRLMSPSFL